MPWTGVDCPICDDEIRIEVTAMEGGYPEEELCEVTDREKNCPCDLSDNEWNALEDKAIEKVDWTPPDEEDWR